MAIPVSDRNHALNRYELKKKQLIQNLLSLRDSEGNIRLHKNTSNLFRDRVSANRKIDVRNFNQIIHVDAENKIAEIEGMATYEDIVKETLKYGCLPAVVPELKSITIGGALAGCGIEASSFRYGLPHETMLEYDVLLSDGRIITCNGSNEHKDLFYAFPNTYGTLGYALKIKIRLIAAKKFIKVTRLHLDNYQACFDTIQKYCKENREDGVIAYIDGVIFDPANCYINLAEFVNHAPYASNYKYMQIYYKSIQDKREDYLTTVDYIWRWDTDWFWCSKQFFMQNFIPRLLLGKFMLKSTVYSKLRRIFNNNKILRKLANKMLGAVESIVQDVEIPIQSAVDFMNFFHQEINIKPVWICPTQSLHAHHSYPFYNLNPETLYINFGFWDMIPSDKNEGYYNREIEKEVLALNGHKSLYSRVYYTENEFWKIYDKKLYLDLKKVYDPKNKFGDLFMKCQGKQ